MKYLVILSSILIVNSVFSQNKERICLKQGRWVGSLKLNETDVLPFEMNLEKDGKSMKFTVINGDEMIALDTPKIENDSIHVKFPYFNSELVFSISNRKSIVGYWQNFNKGTDYRIAFSAEKSKETLFNSNDKEKVLSVEGRWEVAFEPGTESEYPAVGIFEQNGNIASGTFLTETGDYRFLAGNAFNDSLYLSCFDGSHAFLFKAAMRDGKLDGKFFSGSHWKSNWNAKRNATIELANPEDITFLKENANVTFELDDLKGESYSFPNKTTEGKVVIIQIMGTWCPNCLDETMYYKSLQKKYKDQGLEIISVCYETGNSFDDYVKNIERLRDKLDLDFTFIVGGNTNKALASEHFNMLNEVISFPTSIFIGRDGEVKRVHTGFNGPGTGEYYTEYVENTNALIEFLLAQ